jgi:hypothetical protein
MILLGSSRTYLIMSKGTLLNSFDLISCGIYYINLMPQPTNSLAGWSHVSHKPVLFKFNKFNFIEISVFD